MACRAVRLDTVLDIAGKLLVVKIDVEGHEEQAVEGLLALLGRNHCVLQIEIWDVATDARPNELLAIFPRMAAPGFYDDRTAAQPLIDRLAGLGLRHVGTVDHDYFFVTSSS